MKLKAVILTIALIATWVALPVSKATAATYNPNNIIDDSVFTDTTTMNVSQIDAFLNTFPGSCISTNNGFSAPRPTGYNPTQGYLYGSPVSAGQVIYDAAQAYGLNPQVLLTTLQKEEGLVKGDGSYGCSALAISASVGYACTDTDTASHTYVYTNGTDPGTLSTPLFYTHGTPVIRVDNTCVNTSLKAGFTEQIIRAAWLLKFGEQRSEGNIGWAVVKGSWNNSDDPQTCYGGPMTQGTYQRCPSGASAYYDGYTTIDGTSVHMDNGATAALYWYTPHFNGNQNFVAIFGQWFGSLIGSDIVRTIDNPTIYLTSGTMKYPISDMNVVGDFSVLGSIKYVSNDYINGFTTGSTLGHMVGDASGTLYFVDASIKLPFSSCGVVSDYGYNCASVVTLTSYQINKLTPGPYISALYSTTSGKNFYISGGQKHEIFDQQSLSQAGIGGSVNVLLEGGISYLPYGAPVIRNAVLVSDRDNGKTYLYDSNRYMDMSSDISGLSYVSSLSKHSFDDASIAANQKGISFDGFLKDTTNTNNYLLLASGKAKLTTPANWSTTYLTASDDLLAALPSSSDPINNGVVKDVSSPTVYYMYAGQKRPIPSWTDLVNLHATPFAITSVPSSIVGKVPTGSLMFSAGRLVKNENSPTVYVVKSPTELFPISSFVFPSELGLNMSVLNISTSDLQTYTQPSLLHSKVVCADGKNYVGISGQLFEVTSALMTQYGFSQGDFVNAGNLCSNTQNSSKQLSDFIRVSNGTIYYVTNGQKQPITNYNAYIAHGGTCSNTVQVSDYFASLIPSGSSISQ